MPTSNPSPLPTHVVCHVIETLEHGGAQAVLSRLVVGIHGSAYHPVVCCLRGGPVQEQIEASGIPVHVLNLKRPSILAGRSFIAFVFQSLKGLNEVVRTERVTIIHAHMPDGIIWATCAGILTRTPVIGTYHGLGILPAGRWRFDPRNVVRRALYRLVARLSDRSVAVSIPVKDLLCREIGFEENRTVVLINGIDTELFGATDDCCRVRAELGLVGQHVIVCTGRLIAAKGHRFLVEAMASVVREHPNAVLVLVGDGPERTVLEERAHALALGDRVHFVGERNDVSNILAMAEIFVLPSFSEGIPLALVEAMAAGKPVVATAVPGNSDVIGDQRYGVLVPVRDARALADALCGLLRDPARARAIGARGRARARSHFDIKRSLAETTALYDEILAERGVRQGQIVRQ